MVQWMLERSFQMKDEVGQLPNIVQATINDSPEMLKLLLPKLSCSRSGDMSVYMSADYTALDIAVGLGLKQCEDVLLRFNIPSVPRIPNVRVSLINVLMTMRSKRHSRIQLVKKILNLGYDVNYCEEINGQRVSLLYDAILKKDIELMKVLLASGATLFNGIDVTKLGSPPRLLGEYIYHNVDISTEEGSVITNILEGKKQREKLLYLVLHTAHTISRKDRDKLSELCKDIDFFGHNRVIQFLNEPRPLTILSRNAIRKHYAHMIHDFLDQTVLPQSVKDFINLRDKLCIYLEQPMVFSRQTYLDLSKDTFPMDYL